MTKPQLEHIIRAAAGNADVRDIVVIGSQSILGSCRDAPAELLVSMEADVLTAGSKADFANYASIAADRFHGAGVHGLECGGFFLRGRGTVVDDVDLSPVPSGRPTCPAFSMSSARFPWGAGGKASWRRSR